MTGAPDPDTGVDAPLAVDSDPDLTVERVAFDPHADAVESLLRAYHETVAERFRAWLDDRASAPATTAVDFAPDAYVAGELATDRAALAESRLERPLAVARDGDRLVGCAYLYERSPTTAELKRLFVREPYRGRGLGHALVASLVGAATAGGNETLRLDTAPFMDRARRLYRDLGFERFDGEDPVTDVPAPLRDEIVYMRRRLDDER